MVIKILKPKISIIIAVFNGNSGDYNIKKTINSVLNQNYEKFELIVVDGLSKDGTIEVVKKFSVKDDRIKWVSEKDRGIYDAMNKGINLSSGDYLYFLNSDDYLVDNSIFSEVVELIKLNPTSELICGGVSYFRPEGTKINYFDSFNGFSLKRGRQPPHQGTFFKKSLFEKVGLFDINYKSSADFDFFCRCYLKKISSINFNKVVASFQRGGFSSKGDVSFIETSKIIKKYFGLFWWIYQVIVVKTKEFLKFILVKSKLINFFYFIRKRVKFL